MSKVIVKLKPGIAVTGSGFYDFEGKQDIFPPRNKKGKPVVDHKFELLATPFVEHKIASGELVLIKRIEGKTEYPIYVNGKEVSRLKEPEEWPESEEELSQLVIMDKKVQKVCGNKAITSMKHEDDGCYIEVK